MLNFWPFSHLTFKCDLDLQPTWTNISNGTSTPWGEHLCQIILKSMHKCRSAWFIKINDLILFAGDGPHKPLAFNQILVHLFLFLLFELNLRNKILFKPNAEVMAQISLICRSSTIQDKSGKCLTEEKESLSRWTEYCSEMSIYESCGDNAVLDCSQPPEEDL